MKEKKGIVKEFKEFILRGNVIDLAVAVIIGAAFQAIVNSLVKDLITPLIGVITGGVDFSNKYILLFKPKEGVDVSTLVAAQEAGPVLAYGSFITAVIYFVIMAFVIFLLVKGINALRKNKTEEVEEVTVKDCPFCFSAIPILATRCPHCTSVIKVDTFNP